MNKNTLKSTLDNLLLQLKNSPRQSYHQKFNPKIFKTNLFKKSYRI